MGLKKENIISYHCTNYDLKNEVGILWNDKKIKIKWPIKNPIISNKDRLNISLSDYLKIMDNLKIYCMCLDNDYLDVVKNLIIFLLSKK